MAKKQQIPGGNKNILVSEPADPEQLGYVRDIQGASAKIEKILRDAQAAPAGEERENIFAQADTALVEARTTLSKVYKATRKSTGVQDLLHERSKDIDEARTRSAHETNATVRAVKEKEEAAKKEAIDMADLEMQDRFDRGVETDDDKRIMKARKEKEAQESLTRRKAEVRKEMIKIEGSLAHVDAQVDYGEYDKAEEGIVVLESNLPEFAKSLEEDELELTRLNIDPAQDPFIIFYKGQIQQLRRSIEKLREKNNAKKQESLERKADKGAETAKKQTQPKEGDSKAKDPVQEKKADGPESLEDLGTRFENTIAALGDRIPDVCTLPIETPEELVAASDALAALKKDVDACISEYREKVGDKIIRPLFERVPKFADRDDTEKAFTILDRARAEFQSDFLGNKAKNVVGTYQNRSAELSARRAEIGLPVRVFSRSPEQEKQWNERFPKFASDVLEAKNQIFNARVLVGRKRIQELERIQKNLFAPLDTEWRELRGCSPRISQAEIDAHIRTERHTYDGEMKEMGEFLARAIAGKREAKKPDRTVEKDWIRMVIRIEQLWSPDTKHEERGVFLDAYVREQNGNDFPGFEHMILESERANFAKVLERSEIAHGILKAARMNKRKNSESQQDQQRQKEQERAGLRHPLLDVLRASENREYNTLRYTDKFFQSPLSNDNARRLLQHGAQISDEELDKYVSDKGAFREAFAKLEETREKIKATEDAMLAGGEPDGKRDAEGIQRELSGYFRLERMEKESWKRALEAEGWERVLGVEKEKVSGNARKAALAEIFARYAQNGPRILRDRDYGVPEPLRAPIEDWAETKISLNQRGELVQWVLDQNPEVARGMKNIPRVFRVNRDTTGNKPVGTDTVSDSNRETDPAMIHLLTDAHKGGGVVKKTFVGAGVDAGAEAEEAARVVALAALKARRGDASVPDTAIAAAASAAPVVDAVAEAKREAERLSLVRKEAIDKDWTSIRLALGDEMFWNDDADRGSATWAKNLKAFLRLPVGAPLNNESGLRAERKADFYYVAAFTDFTDFIKRLTEIRRKYYPEAAAAAASTSPIEMGPPTGELTAPPRLAAVNRPPPIRPFIPPAPAPVREATPAVTRIAPPPRELVSLGVNPLNRFLNPGAAVAEPQPAPRVEAPRITAQRVVPVVENPTTAESRREPEPVRNTAELRVSGWASAIRNTVGKWFGKNVGDIAAREITGMPTDRERRGEAPSTAEVAYKTLGGMMSVVGTMLGFKSLVDVPRYLTQSFCTTNERALLQADILDAMEANAKTKQRADADPEAVLRANIEAAQRTDRAIATSAYLTDAQRVEMRARVAELQTKYTERTRESLAARSKELAGVLENAVQNRVTGWGAAKEATNTALRVMAFADVPVGVARGVAYGVMAFRDRFEKAATKNPDASFVGKVAGAFRSVWADTWGKLTKQTQSFGERVGNAGDAIATIATTVGMAALAVGALEEALPGLRLAAGGSSEAQGVASLIAEGRLKLQEMVDKVLPTYERLAKRTV